MNETKTEAGAERRAQLRDRLIDIAQEAIAARGLAGLKARDLAAAAGCALGAIYTAFDDLDELILRVNRPHIGPAGESARRGARLTPRRNRRSTPSHAPI